MRTSLGFGAAALAALSLAACSGEDAGEDRAITVMVAASMCSLAEEVEDDLGFEVTTVCSGSSDLAAQIEAGADTDLLITADEKTAENIVAGDRGTQLRIIATNELVMVVPDGNPARVGGFDQSMNESDLVVCAPQVPCGDVSLRLAELNGIELSPVSEEQSVTDVLGKVVSGQADAGLVYRTDANSAGDSVEILDIPFAEDVPNVYPLIVIDSDTADEAEQAWIEAFTRGEGRQRMEDLGFATP